MREAWKYVGEMIYTWCRWVGVTFYLTLVLQILWNWFVITAFHLDEIGYWNMYGLVLLISVVSVRTLETSPAQQWLETKMLLEACVPEGTRAETLRAIEKAKMSDGTQNALTDGLKLFMATVALFFGWVVHTFLT